LHESNNRYELTNKKTKRLEIFLLFMQIKQVMLLLSE
jgi:hypothetical protein